MADAAGSCAKVIMRRDRSQKPVLSAANLEAISSKLIRSSNAHEAGEHFEEAVKTGSKYW